MKVTTRKKFTGEILQLSRLERLSDVIYAIVLWELFTLIPPLEAVKLDWTVISAYFSDHIMSLVLVVLGVVVTIIYWVQNNAVLGCLESTNTRHTALSIFQLFFLLLFLLSMKAGIDLGGSLWTRLFESITASLMGWMSSFAYSHAIKNRRLLRDDVSDKEAKDLSFRIMAEPITAMITIPLAFTPILWEISWLSYLLIVPLLKRREARRQAR
jgi:uncharacterized membrane protein